MSSSVTPSSSWPGFRWLHLFALTERFLAEPAWPQTDRWLKAYFAEHKAYGGKDRAFYREKLFRLCRQAPLVVALQQGYPQGWQPLDGQQLWPLLQQMAPAELWSWLVLLDQAGDKLPREITDGEHRARFLSQCQHDDPEGFSQLSEGWLPQWQPWLQRRIEYSDWTAAQAKHWQAMQTVRPPVWVWCLPGEVSWVKASLLAEGLKVLAERGPALALEADSRIQRSEAWRKGLIEIQDLASQRIVTSLAAEPGERIWDVCAGAGGKALALAAQLGSQGLVLATDIRAHALHETRRRAERLQMSARMNTATWDARTDELPIQNADRVLVDAPCTGTGTWRRSPDARWRLSQQSLQPLNELQNVILSRVATAVRPGGILAYATCSWLVEENEDRVEQFLSERPDFRLIDQRLLGAPDEDADTLFVATLQRHIL